MILDNEEQARVLRINSRRAIALAMEGRWREAVAANRVILEGLPDDVDTLNRLGRAHMELREYDEARAAYKRARELDPYNSIADKNLKRLASLKTERDGGKAGADRPVEPRYFIEETGKAGVVRLSNLAPRPVLARMVAGDRVNLAPSDGSLVVTDSSGTVLGSVEPRHGQRLARLMAGGNKYLATVLSASDTGLAVMIRETYQDISQVGQLSFPSKGVDAMHPYVSDKLSESRQDYEDEPAEDVSLENGEEEAENGHTEASGGLEEEEG